MPAWANGYGTRVDVLWHEVPSLTGELSHLVLRRFACMNEVLIIFEDTTMAGALANAVQFWGYQSRISGTGDDIGVRNTAQVPGVILLELTTSVADTVNSLNEIMSNPTTASVPVIVIAAQGAPDYKQVFFDIGAFEYLGGSWSLAELRRLIGLAIQNRPPLE